VERARISVVKVSMSELWEQACQSSGSKLVRVVGARLSES